MTEEPNDNPVADFDAREEYVRQTAEAAGQQVAPIMNASLNLTKDEQIRSMALAMAVSYHKETIVKDGQMYQAMTAQGKNLRPTAPIQVIDAALVFEGYLRGEYNEFVASMVLEVQHALEDIVRGERPVGDME